MTAIRTGATSAAAQVSIAARPRIVTAAAISAGKRAKVAPLQFARQVSHCVRTGVEDPKLVIRRCLVVHQIGQPVRQDLAAKPDMFESPVVEIGVAAYKKDDGCGQCARYRRAAEPRADVH